MDNNVKRVIAKCTFADSSNVYRVLNEEMIYDLATLRAAKEEDLRECGLKMGEVIKLKTMVSIYTSDNNESSHQLSMDSMDHESSNSNVSEEDLGSCQTQDASEMFSVEDLLSKGKGKGKKPTEAQKFFRIMLRDCARGAKIWSKAPKMEEISDTRWETFFELVRAACPQLGGISYRNELRKRLGQSLQNKRKYRADCIRGKRILKSRSHLNVTPLAKSQKTTTESSSQSQLSTSSPSSVGGNDISDDEFLCSPNNRRNPFPSRFAPTRPLDAPLPVFSSTPTETTTVYKLQVGHEVLIYKTSKRQLKLGRGVYLGSHNGDPNNMYSKVQLLSTNQTLKEEEVPLPELNEDGAANLNDVKLNSMFCWKTAKLGRPNHPSKTFKRKMERETMEMGKGKQRKDSKVQKKTGKRSNLTNQDFGDLEGSSTLSTGEGSQQMTVSVNRNGQEPCTLKNHKDEAIQLHSFVAVAYDERYFVGEVMQFLGNKVQIKFLKDGGSGYYTWPKRKDIANIDVKFIFRASITFQGKGTAGNGMGFIVDEDLLQEEYDAYKNDYM